jgi:hypothetical protein
MGLSNTIGTDHSENLFAASQRIRRKILVISKTNCIFAQKSTQYLLSKEKKILWQRKRF